VQGEYKQAFENFSRSFSISSTLNSPLMLYLPRVLSGVARAHEMLTNYSCNIDTLSHRVALTRLLDWKDNRTDEFDSPLSPLTGLAFSVIYCLPVQAFICLDTLVTFISHSRVQVRLLGIVYRCRDTFKIRLQPVQEAFAAPTILLVLLAV